MRLTAAINKTFYYNDEKGLTYPTYLYFTREKLGRTYVTLKLARYIDLLDFLIDV